MDAPLRERLRVAVLEFGLADEERNYPPDVWPEAHAINRDANRIAGKNGEGSIAATLNAMSDEELVRLSERLFNFYVKLAEGED
ncbi:hypothetical protein D7X99_12405 [Corallococcus sp. AB032C]|uniref:hypothetical protein n=1 Tax=Corallococcus TaxID=83461 RepID=UPI000EED1984|nr:MULTISPECIES: hypothetical protein [Corallococcus]NPC47116.1 hypothetical protein [Corallococcus exiguus]RKH83640.1 hypothetical protein D7X99_12405 [Corallococcus sp. AB032C]